MNEEDNIIQMCSTSLLFTILYDLSSKINPYLPKWMWEKAVKYMSSKTLQF